LDRDRKARLIGPGSRHGSAASSPPESGQRSAAGFIPRSLMIGSFSTTGTVSDAAKERTCFYPDPHPLQHRALWHPHNNQGKLLCSRARSEWLVVLEIGLYLDRLCPLLRCVRPGTVARLS